MSYKDPGQQKEANKESARLYRQKKKGMTQESPVIPENVIPLATYPVIPVEDLVPVEPYDEATALKHMMSMHPVYSDKVITTSGGVVLHPVIGWQEGETWKPTPIVVKVDKAQLARLRKVIKDMELVKVA